MYRSFLKRILDFLLALFGSLLLSPLLLALAVSVKCSSRGPVFFRQKRAGRKNREFLILKFRTMRMDAPKDVPTHMLADPEAYITPVGRFLRRTSLDELPQLFNILRGDMAVVGPRPALWNQDDLLEAREALHANDVRPGLTGWAQVNGRDELPIPVKAAYDGEYAERLSFSFDVKIFFLTIAKVLRREGVREGATKT